MLQKKCMSISVFKHLFPNGSFILGHLHENVERVHSLALVLEEIIFEDELRKRKELLLRSSEIHRNTIEESRSLFETLAKNLITPFDREDIFAIGSGLKIVSSKTDSLIRFIEQNKCNHTQLGLSRLCKTYLKATATLSEMVNSFENIGQMKNTYLSILELRNHYEKIDEYCEHFMVESFDTIDSIKDILVNIDIYSYFNSLSEKLKELAQDTEGLIVKYA